MSMTLETIRAAHARIAPYIVQTPLLRLPALDDVLGCEVYVKAECMQRTGAFKLRGAMNKILAYRDLIGKEMDEESANRAVRDMLRKSNEYIPTAASIIDEVSRFFGIDEAVVKGPSRSREAVTARQAAMYLVRRMTNLSTPDIGREFGGRDHTTVLHALEQVETKLQNDPGFAQTIKDITININSKK